MRFVNHAPFQGTRQIVGIDVDAHHRAHLPPAFQIQHQRAANQPHANQYDFSQRVHGSGGVGGVEKNDFINTVNKNATTNATAPYINGLRHT